MNEPAEPAPIAPRAPAPKRRPRLRVRILVLSLAPLLLAFATVLGWLLLSYPDRPGPGRGRVVEIAITRGEGLEAIAARLQKAGALAEPMPFVAYAALRGARVRLREGSVLLYDNMSPKQVLQRVARGFGSATLRVVIPEGFSRYEIATRLARWGVCPRDAFVRATEDPALLRELGLEGPSAEGWLFPDTYLLRDDMRPQMLVRRFVATARRKLAPLLAEHPEALARLHAELGFGEQALITLASIVEKEAQLASERPLIAGVFLNRLRNPDFKPKRLQADPTVSYGCLVAPGVASCRAAAGGKAITRAMLADPDNPYNTYRREGLPPGPIANPGLSSVRAVLAPAAHDYLYFVAQGGGAHAFSSTLDAHHFAVDRLRAPAQ